MTRSELIANLELIASAMQTWNHATSGFLEAIENITASDAPLNYKMLASSMRPAWYSHAEQNAKIRAAITALEAI